MRILTTRALLLVAALAVLAGAATPALAVNGTEMLGANGTLVTGSSTCATPTPAGCVAGWYTLDGAATAGISISDSVPGTSTVTVYQRFSATGPAWIVKTLTNVTATEVGYEIRPAMGQIKVTVSAIGSSGRVHATLKAFDYTGRRLW